MSAGDSGPHSQGVGTIQWSDARTIAARNTVSPTIRAIGLQPAVARSCKDVFMPTAAMAAIIDDNAPWHHAYLLDRLTVPTLILGYEYALTENTNINLQAYASKSVYRHSDTDLQELLDNKYQVTAGFRHRMNDMIVTFGITENVQNINNTPDIGFQFGLGHTFQSSSPRTHLFPVRAAAPLPKGEGPRD